MENPLSLPLVLVALPAGVAFWFVVLREITGAGTHRTSPLIPGT